MPKGRIGRRMSDALGHSRGRVYRGSTLAAQDAPASSLCDSSGRLLLWQHSGGVPQPAHPSRSPQPRYACARRPAGEGLYRLSASGADAVVSGLTAAPTCTAEEPIGCRGTGSRWLPIFTSRSIQVPCCPWQVALSARYGSGAARFQRAASRGLAGSRTTASGSMARRCSSSLRKTYGRGLRHHILLTPSACWTRQPCLPTRV